jgi:Putative regulator of cell autolysis
MMEKEKCVAITRKTRIFVSKNYLRLIIYAASFLLLFAGGMRFNPISALVISAIDTVWIICLVSFFDWMFSRRSFKFKPLTILAIAVIIFMAANALFIIEYWVWDKTFSTDFLTNYDRKLMHVMFKDFTISLTAFISSLISYSNEQRSRAEKLIFEKQDMEIRFLRSQIHPHFLFNVLNNIYTLAYTKNDQAPEAILKLADMLRYVTDEFQSDTIPIEKEIRYIENFIDLQVMWLGHSDNIVFEFEIDDYSARIPPMIIQPIIENSFKYSDIDTNKESKIFFNLSLKGKHLTFTTYNTKKAALQTNKPQRKGIGISNVEQRLRLYYKKGFSLVIENEEKLYSLKMTIDLSKMNIA